MKGLLPTVVIPVRVEAKEIKSMHCVHFFFISQQILNKFKNLPFNKKPAFAGFGFFGGENGSNAIGSLKKGKYFLLCYISLCY
jgi:hypothetical protein